ncbi:DUF6973 domain-containing protein [Paeniglutamicibacter sp. NPDC091659]|uniref:DUF6973 domain-containing protein n=1 Tax=Paeniglutamicibacter sp. NPDC091659 TaxID=3364389 RepID=UPI0037FD8E47
MASKEASKRFAKKTLHNGKGDAFRHCYWNARMTKSMGSNYAGIIATNHEDVNKGPAKERSMDLKNNATG